MNGSCFGGEIRSNKELFDIFRCKLVNVIFLLGESYFFLLILALLILLLFEVDFLFSSGTHPSFVRNYDIQRN